MQDQKIHRVIIVALFLLSLLSLSSCDDSTNKKEDSNEMANGRNEAKFDEKDKEKDANFLADVAELYMTEIKFGQLAQSKSKDTDIIKLGKLMATDHTKTLEEVTALAKTKQVTLPAAIPQKKQEKYDELNALESKEFDKQYAEMMVNGHKDAIAFFEKTLKDTKDVDINNWIEKKLPGLRKHLDHSEMCQEKLK